MPISMIYLDVVRAESWCSIPNHSYFPTATGSQCLPQVLSMQPPVLKDKKNLLTLFWKRPWSLLYLQQLFQNILANRRSSHFRELSTSVMPVMRSKRSCDLAFYIALALRHTCQGPHVSSWQRRTTSS